MGRDLTQSMPTIIAFEGIDGSGKSSQADLVAAELRARGLRVSQPTSDYGRRLRGVYKSLTATADGFLAPLPSLFLGLGDYADLLSSLAGDTAEVALFDRYCFSPIADAMALGLDPERVISMSRLFPQPDATIVVDVPPRVALKRRGECSVAECGGPDLLAAHSSPDRAFLAYQGRVRDAYRMIAGSSAIAHWTVVDGTAGRDTVTAAILAALSAFLPQPATS